MTTKTAHQTAISSFNSNHSEYDIFRPSFTPLLVNPFLVQLGLGVERDGKFIFDNDKKIVEVACGTGKFTKNLIDNGWGENLFVVEPSKGMLETFSKNFPQIKNENKILASSYQIPLKDSTVDAIIIAQGFHWFADKESLKELNRILKPGGKLGLIWNFDLTSPSQDNFVEKSNFINAGSKYFQGLNFKVSNNKDVFEQFFKNQIWNQEVTQYIYSYDLDVPQYRHGKWREVIKENNEYFHSDLIDSFALYDKLVKPEDVWKYWETRSYITDLNGEEKQKIKNRINDLQKEFVTDSSYSGEHLIKPMGTHSVVLNVKK